MNSRDGLPIRKAALAAARALDAMLCSAALTRPAPALIAPTSPLMMADPIEAAWLTIERSAAIPCDTRFRNAATAWFAPDWIAATSAAIPDRAVDVIVAHAARITEVMVFQAATAEARTVFHAADKTAVT
jgi:hypothetical protein